MKHPQKRSPWVLEELNLKYPTVSEEHRQQLLQAKQILEQED